MAYTYHEKLPESCPEADATPANNERFYRLIKKNPASTNDFISKRMKQPNELFAGIAECICCSVSVYKETEIKLEKLPLLKGKKIALITLSNADGVIKQTFGKGHYSWWRSTDFNIENSITYL